MNEKVTLAAILALTLATGAHAQDIRDQWDIRISKAELVFPGATPQDVANGVKEALSQFAIPANLSFRAIPSSPPARPGTPKFEQPSPTAPSPEYFCEDAYAEIDKRPPPVQNAFAFIAERHQACLYSFNGGVKAYVVYYSAKKLESLTSGLFNGITRAIRGSDEDRAASQLKENVDAIRAALPNVLIERIEIPGLPVETPDLDAVAALIPPAPAVTPITGSGSQANAIAAPPVSSVQAKVEARKSLNAMGMTYHSQQHFIDAIRRKDDVAVQLFIEGGGVRPDVADSTGKTPLQIAEAEGTPEIVALLQPTAQAASPTPAAAAPHSQMQTQPEVPSILRASDAREPEVDFSRVPPELLAEIDGEVAQMSLPPEQAQLARANLARQYLKMKALADALN